MQRVFVAIDISEEARDAATRYAEALGRDFSDARVGWEKPEKLHLTLKFLGKTDNRQLEKLKWAAASAAASTAPISLELSGTGVFPNARNPRILWLGLKDFGGELKCLAETIENDCEKIGYPKENRTFNPHLTVGRIREPRHSKYLAKKHSANQFGPIEFAVKEVVIYKSELHPTGSVYSKLAVFPFGRV